MKKQRGDDGNAGRSENMQFYEQRWKFSESRSQDEVRKERRIMLMIEKLGARGGRLK